ncbi:AAA family ATPase [Paralcaligenes sp. KSB-10]|jgi:chromosome partitioning protein|uniref:ParA family protein n=1 Tax=Paralcaligenes sp. KSB-10 TaxID=2901142 RepID=UPI001E5AC8B5|nr:AAA family ATPase [Paralcaligenes sp. KSB-10]UHL63563.1 AAA family ATPase [Paralcaligenes sp. KSB-10]
MSQNASNNRAHVFCIANQKGGVGKTTTAINLAAALAAHNKRVLLIDLDPQGNATMGSGIDKNSIEKNLYQVLIGEATIAGARVRSDAGGYDVLPANRELSGAEIDLIQMDDREQQLKQAIALIIGEYDFILIDCPPTLSLLTLNGLASAHGVIIPMQCEYFALEGLSDLVNTVKRVHRNINPELHLIGLLRVMFDPRVTLQQQVSAQIETHFGDKVFKAIVPRNVRLAEAPSHGLPGTVYDKNSRGAKAYIEFGNELIKRVKQEAKLLGAQQTGTGN